MRYSERLEAALQTAGECHATQFRKGIRRLPYLTHLVSVAAIVSMHTEDEDTVIAALLHDTIEDTEYTFEQLEARFGKRVRDIVAGVTEPKHAEGGELAWPERKRAYVEGLKTAPLQSIYVAAADKIHNLRSIVEEYGSEPDRFARDFSGDAEARSRYYGAIVDIISERLDNELTRMLRDTFARYQSFLQTL